MNTSRYLAVTALLGTLSLASSARADDTTTTTGTTTTSGSTTTTTTTTMDTGTKSSDQLYRPQELDFDLFGNAWVGQQTLEHFSGPEYRHHGLWGGGGGVTGYFCRYLGVGGDFNADTRSGRFLDTASGNVYFRVPIFSTGLAPYAFGGGGYQFEDVRQSFGQGGAGLEFRFCKNIGIFADGRWIFAEHTDDSALARAGIRISF